MATTLFTNGHVTAEQVRALAHDAKHLEVVKSCTSEVDPMVVTDRNGGKHSFLCYGLKNEGLNKYHKYLLETHEELLKGYEDVEMFKLAYGFGAVLMPASDEEGCESTKLIYNRDFIENFIKEVKGEDDEDYMGRIVRGMCHGAVISNMTNESGWMDTVKLSRTDGSKYAETCMAQWEEMKSDDKVDTELLNEYIQWLVVNHIPMFTQMFMATA